MLRPYTMPSSRSRSISAPPYPKAASTSDVCSPRSGEAGAAAAGVSLNSSGQFTTVISPSRGC